MADDTAQLAALPEDWDVALAIVAHPDDMEYGASAAVSRWTEQGKSVAYVLVTAGEAGIDGMSPEEAGPLRVAEQEAACAAVGVDDLEVLHLPDGMLEYGLDLRRALAAEIRRVQPQVLLTINHRERFGFGALNQADHIATGRAVVDAARDAGNRWVFRDLAEERGLEPWGGVKMVAVANSPDATHAVAVSDHDIDRAVASLAAHDAYLQALGDHPMADPETFLRPMFGAQAVRFGDQPCVTFEVLPI